MSPKWLFIFFVFLGICYYKLNCADISYLEEQCEKRCLRESQLHGGIKRGLIMNECLCPAPRSEVLPQLLRP